MELLGREISSIEGVGQDGEPRPGALRSGGLSLGGLGLVGHQSVELKLSFKVPGFGHCRTAGPGGFEVVSHIQGGPLDQGLGEGCCAGEGGCVVGSSGLAGIRDPKTSMAHWKSQALSEVVGEGLGRLLQEGREEAGL
jgi:hypothetical protein